MFKATHGICVCIARTKEFTKRIESEIHEFSPVVEKHASTLELTSRILRVMANGFENVGRA